MTNSEKLNIIKERYNRLSNSQKSIKCGGVVRKLARQIRNAEK